MPITPIAANNSTGLHDDKKGNLRSQESGMSIKKIVRLCDMCGADIPKPKRGSVGKTCSSACRQKLSRTGKTCDIHTKALKTCDTPPGGAYTASNIVIMGASERISNPMFDWEWAEELAHEFTRPSAWIKRGFLACREAGVSPEYFIDRYLHRKLIPMNTEVDQTFRTLGEQAT